MPRQQAHRRIKPHGFFQHLIDERHGVEIVRFRHPAPQLGTGFVMGAGLVIRAVGQQIKRPGDGQRRGLMPRHNEELHIADQVFRRHAAAGFRVLRRQHMVKQIVGGRRGFLAARLDRLRHHAVHSADRRARDQFARPGKPFRHAQKIQQRGAAGGVEITGDGVTEGGGVKMLPPRQRHIADHIEGGGEHFRHQLGAAGAREPRHGAGGGGAHGGGQRQHIAVRKHRRHRLALPFPFRAVGIEQAFADGGTQHAPHDFGFGIVGKIVQHHPLVAGGISHHVPAAQGFAGDDGLAVGDGRNDLQHIAARRQRDLKPAEAAAMHRRGGGYEILRQGNLLAPL